jgi:hypothetical protein
MTPVFFACYFSFSILCFGQASLNLCLSTYASHIAGITGIHAQFFVVVFVEVGSYYLLFYGTK